MSDLDFPPHGCELSRRSLLTAAAVVALLPPAFAAQAGKSGQIDLSFSAAFPRRFYEKSYFGIAVTGAAIIAAGAFSYATAGAGAPAAATGISTVASWVAGGGAGSYMAGLSTIGGWFGGNAMVGAAILNGISLGTVGGMTSFGALSAAEKAIVVTSVAATTLDGIALFKSPDTQQLAWDVRLPVPIGLAGGGVKELAERLDKANEKLVSLLQDLAEARSKASKASAELSSAEPSAKVQKLEADLAAEGARQGKIIEQLQNKIDAALASAGAPPEVVVLAVLAHNFGKPEKFRKLLAKVNLPTLNKTDASYLDYLKAVAALQVGKEGQAIELLHAAWQAAPYAIEAPILLVNILGSKGRFVVNERTILDIATKAGEGFDADKYASRVTPVSIHYRIGSQALQAKRCETALDEFSRAGEALSSIQKYVYGKDIRNLIDLGKANALYCASKQPEAFELFGAVLKRGKDDEKDLLCAQFLGGCRK